jgi:hypothetical protein
MFLGRDIKGPLDTKWDQFSMSVDQDKKVRDAFGQQAFDCLKQLAIVWPIGTIANVASTDSRWVTGS